MINWLDYIYINKVWDTKLCGLASQYGNLLILQKLKNKGCKWDDLTCNNAVLYNNLHCLIILMKIIVHGI